MKNQIKNKLLFSVFATTLLIAPLLSQADIGTANDVQVVKKDTNGRPIKIAVKVNGVSQSYDLDFDHMGSFAKSTPIRRVSLDLKDQDNFALYQDGVSGTEEVVADARNPIFSKMLTLGVSVKPVLWAIPAVVGSDRYVASPGFALALDPGKDYYTFQPRQTDKAAWRSWKRKVKSLFAAAQPEFVLFDDTKKTVQFDFGVYKNQS